MGDWATIASMATAVGTLVLGVATFASVRSANRAARTAERALQIGLRPVLSASRPQDPPETLRWGDDHWATLDGGRAVVDLVDDRVYMAMSLRNVGAGLAVIHGWRLGSLEPTPGQPHPPTEEFRLQRRDLYVASGDVGFWQAAIREHDDPSRGPLVDGLRQGEPFVIDLLYGDHEGGQRAISRFIVTPRPEATETD
jgi:hypothetical protein